MWRKGRSKRGEREDRETDKTHKTATGNELQKTCSVAERGMISRNGGPPLYSTPAGGFRGTSHIQASPRSDRRLRGNLRTPQVWGAWRLPPPLAGRARGLRDSVRVHTTSTCCALHAVTYEYCTWTCTSPCTRGVHHTVRRNVRRRMYCLCTAYPVLMQVCAVPVRAIVDTKYIVILPGSPRPLRLSSLGLLPHTHTYTHTHSPPSRPVGVCHLLSEPPPPPPPMLPVLPAWQQAPWHHRAHCPQQNRCSHCLGSGLAGSPGPRRQRTNNKDHRFVLGIAAAIAAVAAVRKPWHICFFSSSAAAASSSPSSVSTHPPRSQWLFFYAPYTVLYDGLLIIQYA